MSGIVLLGWESKPHQPVKAPLAHLSAVEAVHLNILWESNLAWAEIKEDPKDVAANDVLKASVKKAYPDLGFESGGKGGK